MHRIELFYDVVSPYAWFAFETLCRYRERWQLDLVLRPFDLGRAMRATHNKPPAAVPAKLPWVQRDLVRNRDYFQVPIRPPSKDLPLATARAMRLLTVVARMRPGALETASRALWTSLWIAGRDTSRDDVLHAALAAAGVTAPDTDEWHARVDAEDTRIALERATDEAVARGAFGTPTMFVPAPEGEEMFFGSDRFPHLARFLGVEWRGPTPTP